MPTSRSFSPIVLTTVPDCSPRRDRCIRSPSGCCSIGWNENRSAREEIADVITHGDADYYIAKPTVPAPDERFHRAITEFLDDWWRLRGRPFEAVRIVGDDRSPRAHEICDLLQRHDFPYTFHGTDSDAGREVLEDAGARNRVRSRSSSSTAAHRSSIRRTSKSPRRSAHEPRPAKACTTSS